MSRDDHEVTRLATVRSRIVGVAAFLLLPMLVLSGLGFALTEEGAQIPVHWNAQGEVDRHGSRWEAFGVAPAMLVLLAALFALLPALEPRREHLARSVRPYFTLFLAPAVLLVIIHGTLVANAVGWPVDVVRIVMAGVGGLLMVIGNTLAKVRSNFFVGIRTPWTLSSERSWYRTHRLGGWLFVSVGFLMLAGTLLPRPATAFWLCLSCIGAVVVTLVVYSYLQWRADPARPHGDGAVDRR